MNNYTVRDSLELRRLRFDLINTYKILFGLVHGCMVTDVRARKLRSADTRTLAVNRTCSSFSDRTFAAAATGVWNSLPPDMRKPELSYGQFRRSLKTFLFGQ